MSNKDHHLYAVVCFFVVLPVWAVPPNALATEESLRLVPEDAAFYWSVSNTREQVERVANSKAVARIGDLITESKKQAGVEDLDVEEQLEKFDLADPLKAVKNWFEQEENKELMALSLDMISKEIFIYGDNSYVEFASVYAEAINQFYKAMARSMKEQGSNFDEGELVKLFEQFVDDGYLDKLNVPVTVIGFELKDPQRAVTQLARLNEMLPALVKAKPEIAEQVKWEKIGNRQYLTFKADGSLIPWDEFIDGDLDELQRKLLERIKPIIEKKTVAAALGVHEGYLLLSFGDTNDHLKTLGEGKSLFEHPDLKKLREHADKKIVSTAYYSDSLAKNSYNLQMYFEHLGDIYSAMLFNEDFPLDDMVRRQIARDIKSLMKDLSELAPRPGQYVGFSLMTSRGYEGFTQSWTENLFLDGDKPLDITQHVGGNPILVAAARAKYRPQDYELMVKWLIKFAGYSDQFWFEQLDEEQQQAYKTFREAALPTLKQIDQVISKKWIPAQRDGQRAFVLDAKLKGRQFHVLMPPAEQDLAVIEPAFVFRVENPEDVKQGAVEVIEAMNTFAAALHEIKPDEIAQVTIPLPEQQETKQGDLFSYSFFEQFGGDKQIAPTAGLSKDTLVYTLSHKHANRLLKSTKFKPQGVVSQHIDGKLAAMSQFDWARLVDVVVPWIEYGIEQRAERAAIEEDIDPALDVEIPNTLALKQQVRDAAQFLKCFRGVSSATMVEGDSLVTHYEWQFEDLRD